MDHGKLTGLNGKTTDLPCVVLLLMTSSVSARDHQQALVGFGAGQSVGDAEREYKRMFSPEFRNRLDSADRVQPAHARVMFHIVRTNSPAFDGQLVSKRVDGRDGGPRAKLPRGRG